MMHCLSLCDQQICFHTPSVKWNKLHYRLTVAFARCFCVYLCTPTDPLSLPMPQGFEFCQNCLGNARRLEAYRDVLLKNMQLSHEKDRLFSSQQLQSVKEEVVTLKRVAKFDVNLLDATGAFGTLGCACSHKLPPIL